MDAWVLAFRQSCIPEVTVTSAGVVGRARRRGADARTSGTRRGVLAAQARDPKTFDEPFAFFTASSGMFLAQGRRELVPLPDPGDEDQSLPIVPMDGRT